MNEPHNKGATSASPNDLNGDGYEHRDLHPVTITKKDIDDYNAALDKMKPQQARDERAVVVSFRSADLADTQPPDAAAPTTEPTVAVPQQPAEKSGGRRSATRHLAIGDGDHLVVFAERDVVIRSERSGANFDGLGTISIEDAAAAVFAARNDWPANLREAVLIRLSRMKWGSGTGTVAR